jgi:D-alanine-D-alanine ligase
MDMSQQMLKVMVLAGGPDRERPVSLASGAQVAEAVRAAGHEAVQRDVTPDDLSALDAVAAEGFDVIFPILHGAWGEGGGLQTILDERGLAYVGSRHVAAALCMDKLQTKLALAHHRLPTPEFETCPGGGPLKMKPPLVLKPLREGSSIDLYICHDSVAVAEALRKLTGYDQLLAERFIAGPEMTVGVLGDGDAAEALPPIHIVPATAFYDYDAKYERDDTRYLFGDQPAQIDARLRSLAVLAHRVLGCRHLCRVDFMIDPSHGPMVIEVNTLPGFTTHSLLPMAAAKAGLPMPQLVDRLLRMAASVNSTAAH